MKFIATIEFDTDISDENAFIDQLWNGIEQIDCNEADIIELRKQ